MNIPAWVGVSLIVIAGGHIILGSLLLLKNPTKSPVNTYFALAAFFSSIFCFVVGMQYITLEGIWNRMNWAGCLIISSLMMGIFYLYDKRPTHLVAKGLFLYITMVCITAMGHTKLVIKEIISLWPERIIWGPVEPFVRIYMGIVIGWAIISLISIYSRSQGIKRVKLKYFILGGLMYGGLGVIFTVITPLAIRKCLPAYPAYASFPWLLLTTYAIIRYRLMDIEVVISKTLLFFLLIGFIFLFYTVSLWLLSPHLGYIVSSLISAGLTVAILFLTPFRQKLRSLVETVVYRGKYNYQKVLKDSTKALVTMLDLRQLLNYIVNTISETVGVEKISLFLEGEGKRRYEIKASYGLDEELVDNYVLKPNEGIIPWLKQSKAVFIKEEMERALPGKAFENIYGDLGKIGAEFVLPLFYKHNLVGVLNLFNKQSGGIYNQTDIDILESLGAEAAVAIENARLHTEVITDELTGLYQPKYFELRLREEIEKAKRYRHCLSLMMVEVDNFEEFKERYGEERRDKLLKSIAGIVRGNLRVGDIACRCGEKGLVIILPEITEEPWGNIRERLKKQIRETVEIGERLRRRVKEEELGVTVSIGIASFDGQNREMKKEILIKQAKEALGQAKREGNTVKVFYDEKLRREISTEVLEWIKETEETLISGEICVDLVKHTVQVKSKPVKLTPKGFDLLCLLMKKKGRVLNRSFITESIWGYEYFGTTRTVDSHIKLLRQKLGSEGKKIKTIEGIGYKFTEESE